MAEWETWQYTVVGTPCRRSSAEIEFRQSGRLAVGASLGGAAFGSSRGPATWCESKSLQDSKMVSYSNGKYLKFRRGLNRWLIFARLKLRLFVCSMHPKAPVLQSDLKPPLLPKRPAGYPRVTRESTATKSFMITSLKRAESDRIWLSGEAAMAGRENQGDLWDLTSGLDLQPPIVCADFRTLSLASVQNLRR